MMRDPVSTEIHRAISRKNCQKVAEDARQHRRTRLLALWENRYALSAHSRRLLRYRLFVEFTTVEGAYRIVRSEMIRNGWTEREAEARSMKRGGGEHGNGAM